MNTNQHTGQLKELIAKANKATQSDVDFIMGKLTSNATLVMTRNIDFALSLAEGEDAKERIKYYLFKGTQIQRNYASLYFIRIGEWRLINEAYQKGLIDELQAYSR